MREGFPLEGMELTHILVVSEMARSRRFYHDVLGAEIFREYGGTSCVLRFQGAWLLLVTGGGPTEDKPDVTFSAPTDRSIVSHAMTIRVGDCVMRHSAHEERSFSPRLWIEDRRFDASSAIPMVTCWRSVNPGDGHDSAVYS